MPDTTTRLDRELVRRGLARSREQAGSLIAQGRVFAGGKLAKKPAFAVSAETDVRVDADPEEPDWASRAGGKIAGALERLGVAVAGRRCLDAGAAHGGFTDVLLRLGASWVAAVDVGHDQLLPRLREDPRVAVFDGVNVRHMTPETIGGEVDLVVADLSFISLRLVLPALAACVREAGELVVMVKPQFEAAKHEIGRGGVVRDAKARIASVLAVAEAASAAGLAVQGAAPSPVAGRSGNLEAFLWLRRSAPKGDFEPTIRAGLADWDERAGGGGDA
ncbi:TlyA family RNA methyltransferase [Segniliparus rugosus]|uniref:Hemolysin TlyA family protein n=1 Tax=Segniliparus rugosus (strain ATCC BAA-974 / DSM 45345 / CCUG 50838 / CIP 108380 / JCM 13579 / CDC 945) TaxID=679197 RepID=E5XPP1_SEGRC|nr:TlyA family RNA methyltransferase [Segniliparus rugosus]EFV13686.1 hemolysin TlyA family protein [Segniliparus rugosus ATCC BAA-974]